MSFKFFSKGKNSRDSSYSDILHKVKQKSVPQHVAIIMDGNGRWARLHGLPRVAGHRQGVETLRNIIKASSDAGIKYLTLYAFSTENWKRPLSEINALMSLLVEYLKNEINELHHNGVKINILGDISPLPIQAREEIYKAVSLTKPNTGLTVNIALNYGGRAEIINSVKMLVGDICKGLITADDINEEMFKQYLNTKDMPDPDLLIRTSGEHRISNFLLYQIAYSELYFTPPSLLWPDFDRISYLNAIVAFQNRDRRYGGIYAGEDE